MGALGPGRVKVSLKGPPNGFYGGFGSWKGKSDLEGFFYGVLMGFWVLEDTTLHLKPPPFILMGFWVLEDTKLPFKAPYLYLKGIFGSWKVQRSTFEPPTL